MNQAVAGTPIYTFMGWPKVPRRLDVSMPKERKKQRKKERERERVSQDLGFRVLGS